MALYGKMPSVTYQDYPEATLIVLWGVNPSASGIHLVPYMREAQKRGAKLVVVDPRDDAARARGRHPPAGAAGHRRRGRARDPSLPVRERARRRRRSCARTRTGADRLRERAEPWTIERAAEVAGIEPAAARARRRAVRDEQSPALIRCGWGLERNRNGGNAAMAVLALPAVGGKFGVRGGGYSMSNSASWDIERTVDRRARAGTRASST